MALPKFFHLDKRVELILERLASMPDAMLLSTSDVALLYDCSEQWLTIGRSKGYGPDYITLAKNLIRYTVGDLRQFCEVRRHRHTAEYTGGRQLSEEHRANMRAGQARRRAEREAKAEGMSSKSKVAEEYMPSIGKISATRRSSAPIGRPADNTVDVDNRAAGGEAAAEQRRAAARQPPRAGD